MIDRQVIEDFIESWDAANSASGNPLAETTIQARRQVLEDYQDWYAEDGREDNILEATQGDVQRYIQHLQRERELASQTIESKYTQALNLFYRHQADDDNCTEVDVNPLNAIKSARTKTGGAETMQSRQLKDGEHPHISPEDKEKLAENVPAPKTRNELIIRLLWQTGVREHELRNIKLEDVDHDVSTIDIRSKKTNEWRTVKYHDRLEVLMQQWINQGYRDRFKVAEESNYLFVSRKREKLAQGSVNKVVKKAAKAANVQADIGEDANGNIRRVVTTHCLRHSFAIQALRNGVNVRYVQEAMGHSSIETTQDYLQYVEQDMLDAMEKHGPGYEAADG